MTKFYVEEIHHIKEDVFGKLITYPTITTISKTSYGPTKVIGRNGSSFLAKLTKDGSRWISVIRGNSERKKLELTLEDITRRVSCGVATGEDKVFVVPKDHVPQGVIRAGLSNRKRKGPHIERHSGLIYVNNSL